jgi:hypothetical protein
MYLGDELRDATKATRWYIPAFIYILCKQWLDLPHFSPDAQTATHWNRLRFNLRDCWFLVPVSVRAVKRGSYETCAL